MWHRQQQALRTRATKVSLSSMTYSLDKCSASRLEDEAITTVGVGAKALVEELMSNLLSYYHPTVFNYRP
eukprot:218518-Amphidinium_carterae.1